MSHGAPLVLTGPGDPRAFEGIPEKPRPATMDERCPTCKARGRWITELHGHGRTKTQSCDHCLGYGWLETTGDATPIPDIIMGPHGAPMWITRWVPLTPKPLDT